MIILFHLGDSFYKNIRVSFPLYQISKNRKELSTSKTIAYILNALTAISYKTAFDIGQDLGIFQFDWAAVILRLIHW